MKRLVAILIVGVSVVCASSAHAQGELGKVLNWILPGAGTVADDINGRLKDLIPIYGQTEGALSELARKASAEIGGELGGPVLANWIRASKRSVEDAGVAPVPDQLRTELRGIYPFIDGVRFRVGIGNELAVPANVFRGGAIAVTLDNVIVFRQAESARSPVLWAHELRHVGQYRDMGVDEFAKRYVKYYEDVEADADRGADAYLSSRPYTSTGARSANLASCTGRGGVQGVTFWGAEGETCNGLTAWGTYNSAPQRPDRICSCRGRGGVNGVRLWGPEGQACGGFQVWGTYSEQCVSATAVPVCACPGKGDVIGNHAIWGPAGQFCGGFPGWGVYEQMCKMPR